MIKIGKKRIKRKRKEKEIDRKNSYVTRRRVTCLFRVVEQIYIALSPPVIPLSRCCCRTLDSVRRREIKGKKGEKKKKKKRNIVSWNIGARGAVRRNVPRVMYAPSRGRAFISPRVVFVEDYPRYVAYARTCCTFIFGSALCRAGPPVKPACPRQS